MSETVIKVERLSKQYRLGKVGRGTLRHDLNRWVYRLVNKEDPYIKIGEENDRSVKGNSEYVWALHNIDFELKQGEVLGIIGKNGAGKSTLLKILSKVTTPTTGVVKIKGRISSLLEVGTGFHPELSGRDNVFLNGAILGMTKKEIRDKFDEIVDFSGVERYIDTPVKRYSSGMYVRLAFAVAAHLEPDILIVDEVLAVGDVEFQKKCLGKLKDVSKKDGRTVLFVSHQMDAINRLCEKVMVLKNGYMLFNGNTAEGVRIYGEKVFRNKAVARWDHDMPGNSIVKLLEVCVLDNEKIPSDVININEPVFITLKYEVIDRSAITTGINLYNEEGVHLFASHDIETAKQKKVFNAGIYEATVIIPSNFLAEGIMTVSVGIMSYDPFIVHIHEKEVVSFTIKDTLNTLSARGVYGGMFPGIIRPILNWNIKQC